jgi:hypothetical protein
MPDNFIAEKIKPRSKDNGYVQMPSMPSFGEAFENLTQVRERLFSVKPETDLETSISYIKDASYALFMARAKQGISKSGSNDLIPFFQKLMEPPSNNDGNSRLQAIVDGIRGSPIEKGSIDVTAYRFKAAFSLLKAARVRRHEMRVERA